MSTRLLDFPVEDRDREEIRQLLDFLCRDSPDKPNVEVLADKVINAMGAQGLLPTLLNMLPFSRVTREAVDHTNQRRPPLERLRHLLRTHFPVLYAQVLEPTLADLREEHSSARAEGCPWKARRVLLHGCGALAAAAVYQLGLSLLGRIAALWQARSSK